MQGIQIGQLLVEQGVLSAEQVEHILTVQRASHRPFGDLAERLFGIEPQAVEDAWVEQYLRTVWERLIWKRSEYRCGGCRHAESGGRRGSFMCCRCKRMGRRSRPRRAGKTWSAQ